MISASDPEHSGALGLGPGSTEVLGAYGRSPSIPLAARNLGDGRSAFKPVADGRVALVFDNLSGELVGSCQASAALATRDLDPPALSGCDPARGFVLSGSVRFSSSTPPQAGAANDTPLALGIGLIATSGSTDARPPTCSAQALTTVVYTLNGATRVEAVPLAALPASVGATAWSETGDRFVAYHCAVYPAAGRSWSGRTTLTAEGWTIGSGPTDRRVCRYSADTDRSGAIDRNVEHPAGYVDLAGSLAQQNFLVIAGTQSCPTGAPPPQPRGAADLSTVQHQP